MPELPEVETTRRAIAPALEGQTIARLLVRERRMRWPIPTGLEQTLRKQPIRAVRRRAKYLLLETPKGTALIHLGMSGHLRVLPKNTPAQKHDHWDLLLENDALLRLHDPRRFGALLWTTDDPEQHALLQNLGPEPLSSAFNAADLYARSRGRSAAVKAFIMDQHIVVGVGNIYANEALFLAGIDPRRAAGRITLARYERLVASIKSVLSAAIEVGGTTLRDFYSADGERGYFTQQLHVYGRGGLPCLSCGRTLKEARIGQRASVWCPSCQR
ncbi:MAG: bifunctional DNA-formamidopyrimidine glycosylase/DNA-(apurinic or apyrimidinic site) lyase [Gammaproteobacteria bacterium]